MVVSYLCKVPRGYLGYHDEYQYEPQSEGGGDMILRYRSYIIIVSINCNHHLHGTLTVDFFVFFYFHFPLEPFSF